LFVEAAEPVGRRRASEPQSGFGTFVLGNFIRFCDERNPQGAAGVWLVGRNQDAPLAHAFSPREKA